MAAINNKKKKSMECSYLKDHQLAFLLFSAGRAFCIRRNIQVEMLHWFNKTKQMKHPKLRDELRLSEE